MTTLPSAALSTIRIRHALAQESETVLDILNRATDKLLAKGVKQWIYPWQDDAIRQGIESGEQFLAVEAEQVVAVFKFSRQSSNTAVEAAQPGNLYLSQLALDPLQQNQGVGKSVMEQILRYAVDMGKTLYLDCWAGNTKLKAFYQSCGLESLGDFPEENFFITVFRARHFEEIH
ncbi:MAG: GNAT family N-acetyltransferase [Anaerolineaceae bacterium]